jgi:2-dehydro-3-deoxy-D-arabinonate dehydratase
VKLYRTNDGPYVEHLGKYYRVPGEASDDSWDALIAEADLQTYLGQVIDEGQPVNDLSHAQLVAPIGNQEVWAAGVTYYRSRSARIEESKDAGGGDFYDRVYSAERPELFFKSTASRVAGPGSLVRIRSDASWSVPEPELTLLINPGGQIIGYTIGNDMSSRDIEGENPLYLPQAKVYDRSCALGPCILIGNQPPPSSTQIQLEILRGTSTAFSGETTLAELKREPGLLVDYLFRDNVFPSGSFLMTGTGIVPPDSFALRSGDRIRITIAPIGTLVNDVA